MTERAFGNLDLWMWEYTDNPRNYPGVHLTGRTAACDTLAEWLIRMQETPGGVRRTIPLRPLQSADVAKISGRLPYRWFTKLELAVMPERDDLKQMSIRSEGERVIVEVTPARIGDLLQGIRDVRAGTGDYAIRPKGGRALAERLGQLDRESLWLWFWPCFGHLAVD